VTAELEPAVHFLAGDGSERRAEIGLKSIEGAAARARSWVLSLDQQGSIGFRSGE